MKNEDFTLENENFRFDRFNKFKQIYYQLSPEEKVRLKKQIEDSPSYQHIVKDTPPQPQQKTVVEELYDMIILFGQLEPFFKESFKNFISEKRFRERCPYYEDVKFSKFSAFKKKYDGLFTDNRY